MSVVEPTVENSGLPQGEKLNTRKLNIWKDYHQLWNTSFLHAILADNQELNVILLCQIRSISPSKNEMVQYNKSSHSLKSEARVLKFVEQSWWILDIQDSVQSISVYYIWHLEIWHPQHSYWIEIS